MNAVTGTPYFVEHEGCTYLNSMLLFDASSQLVMEFSRNTDNRNFFEITRKKTPGPSMCTCFNLSKAVGYHSPLVGEPSDEMALFENEYKAVARVAGAARRLLISAAVNSIQH